MTLPDTSAEHPARETTQALGGVDALIASRAFVAYVQALGAWLEAPPSDVDSLRPATTLLCSAMHAEGVQPEHVLSLLRGLGTVPLAFQVERADRELGARYSRAVWLLLRHAFGEASPRAIGDGAAGRHVPAPAPSPSPSTSPAPFALTVEVLHRWLDEPEDEIDRLRAAPLRLCDQMMRRAARSVGP